jgi:hypothetical protein
LAFLQTAAKLRMAAGRPLWDKKNKQVSEGSDAGKFDTRIAVIAKRRPNLPA